MKHRIAAPTVNPESDFPVGPLTKHFTWDDMRCRGFDSDPCRAIPPEKAIHNLTLVFTELAEPFTEFLKGYRIPKSPRVLTSYVCPKCATLRKLHTWDGHLYGRAVDLTFGHIKPMNSLYLKDIAMHWQLETGVKCKFYMHYTCLHLELDRSIGFTIDYGGKRYGESLWEL